MKGIFHPDRRFWEEEPWPSVQEIRNLDLKEDRCYLEYMVQYARGSHLTRLMKRLGISELPEKTRNLDDPSDRESKFAFCRLTKYCYPSPWNDAYSYRTYECGWKEGMTTEDVIEFCREMITVQGPFAREAEEILADPPGDHNDYNGNRMASHERAKSEPPYVRKERLAPFRESAEYEQSRAEVLQLEAQAHEAIAAGDSEKAVMLLAQMSSKSEQRCCIAWSEVSNYADGAEEAAEILRRLIKEGPEEKIYREQLQKAEAVFRKAAKETALQTGFTDAESPIVIYHSLEPKYAEVFCRLLEERFRERGGTREIAFRWQESAPHAWEAYAEAQRRPQIRWQESGCRLKSGGRSRAAPRVRLKTTRSTK